MSLALVAYAILVGESFTTSENSAGATNGAVYFATPLYIRKSNIAALRYVFEFFDYLKRFFSSNSAETLCDDIK